MNMSDPAERMRTSGAGHYNVAYDFLRSVGHWRQMAQRVMKTVGRVIVTTFIALCAVVLAAFGAYLFVDDATLVSLVVQRLETASNTRISYRHDAAISRTWAPTLSVEQLVIADVEARYRLEIRSLQLQISLPGLLLGQLDIPRLWLGDTQVTVGEEFAEKQPAVEDATDTVLDTSILRRKVALHDVQISEFVIHVEGDTLRMPASQIKELSLRLEPDAEIAELSAKVALGSESLDINASMPNLQEALKQKQLPFSISLKGAIGDSSMVGKVDLNPPAPVVQAELRVDVPDLKKVPGDRGLELPGSLDARAQLRGTVERLALDDLSADWTGPGDSAMTLNGRMGDVNEAEDIELSLAGRLDKADWLAPWWPETMSPLNTADLAAQIAGKPSQLRVRAFHLQARTGDELDLSLDGQFHVAHAASAPELENLDLKLAFAAPATRAARALLFDTIPEFGAIEGRTEIRSSRGDPAFENIVVQTKDEQGIQVDLTGRIAQFPLAPDKPNQGYDLDVRMQAIKTSVMAERAGFELPLNGPLELTYRIEGDTQALQLNRIGLSASDTYGTRLNAKGQILFREWDRDDPLQAIDLVLDYSARDAGILRAWLEQDFPPLAYSAHARLHTVAGQHRIDDFRFTTAPGEPLHVSETGSAERVTFLPEFSIEGIRIDSSIETDDVAKLNALFQLENKIPSLGPLVFHATATGTDRKLLIDDVLLTAGEKSVLQLKTNGRLGYISAEKQWRLENTDLAVNAQAPSSQSLAEALGYRLPPLGPVQMRASVNDKDKTLGVDAIRIRVGDAARPILQSHGSIGDLYAPGKIRVVTELKLGGHEFAAFADKHELPDLGALTGRMVISDSNGSLGIDSLHVESTRHELFSLYVDGQFDDFDKPDTLELNSRMTARDMKLVGALLDRDWPDHGRVEFIGRLRRAGPSTSLNATLTSGREKFDIALSGTYDATPPHIKGKITAVNFFVPDLFERARQKRTEKIRSDTPSPETKPVFSHTPIDLDWLKTVDLDLSVNIQSFDRNQSAAESADATIRLKSGHLSVRPAKLVYPKGHANLDLQLGAKDPLEASFTFKGENLDPWRGLNIFEPDTNGVYKAEDTELDVKISLSASGNSLHQLASNLQGEFFAAVRNGQITQSKTRLLFVDVVGWATDLKAQQRYDRVNCGVGDFSFRQGVVDTNAFFMDMDHITIAGEGTIDLGQERIDYVLIPRKKSRLILKAEPVDVKGPLNDPNITAIPVKSLALQAGKLGTLLFAPYAFAGILAGEFAGGKFRNKGEDSSVCLEYLKTRQTARKAR